MLNWAEGNDNAEFIDSVRTVAWGREDERKDCKPCGRSPITSSRPFFTVIGHFWKRTVISLLRKRHLQFESFLLPEAIFLPNGELY
jgi:hypothetical protein